MIKKKNQILETVFFGKNFAKMSCSFESSQEDVMHCETYCTAAIAIIVVISVIGLADIAFRG